MSALLILAASFVAVLLTALAVHWAGYGDARLEGEAEARALAEAMVPGFAADDALVCPGGAAALVRGAQDGRQGAFVVLKRVGNRFAARALTGPQAVRADGDGVAIDSGDRMFGAVAIACPDMAMRQRWVVPAGAGA
jgi:hypothetical protein